MNFYDGLSDADKVAYDTRTTEADDTHWDSSEIQHERDAFRNGLAEQYGLDPEDIVQDGESFTIDGMPWSEWIEAVFEEPYASESNDRTERKSCGDPDELAAQERWIREHS